MCTSAWGRPAANRGATRPWRLPGLGSSGRPALVLLATLIGTLAGTGCDPGLNRHPPSQELRDAPGAPLSEERRTDHRGGQVAYLALRDLGATGSAPTLVLIHGWASTRLAWEGLLDEERATTLLAERRMLVIDLPGHGASSPLPEDVPYSLAELASAVVSVLEAEEVERAILVGHSNGTPVAMQVLHRAAERVAAVVAVDGAVVPVATRDMVEPMLEKLRGEDAAATVEGMVRGMAGQAFDEETTAALVEMTASVDRRALVESVESAADASHWGNQPVTVPLLLVLAEQPTWDETYRTRVAEIAADATWIVWPDTNHFLQLQRPDEFVAAVDGWLREQGL